MTTLAWFLVAGGVLIFMALLGTVVSRLPLSGSILYLAVGVGIGTVGRFELDVLADAKLVETIAEIAVLISLFTAGLKLRARWTDRIWRVPLRLASLAMILTVAAITLVGWVGIGLSLGAALIVAAAIAPTDPVLASDVQVSNPLDRDRLRFGLTGEAGLNDGTAFPFVLLGIGLLATELTLGGALRWLAVDVLYATSAGLAIGWGLGAVVGRFVLYLRVTHREAVGADEFLALGLMAISYGVALALGAYGFLAVFAAGLALRGIEARSVGPATPPEAVSEAQAVDPSHAPAYMATAVLGFNQQLERVAEVAIVITIGALLANVTLPAHALWFVPLVFLVIRPLAVWISLLGTRLAPGQRALCSWFGVRGVGSLYYIAFACEQGFAGSEARFAIDLVLVVVATSIVVHGISVTPLMNVYGDWLGRRRSRTRAPTSAPRSSARPRRRPPSRTASRRRCGS